jgi:hypothetical protein
MPSSKYRDLRNEIQDGNEGAVIKELKNLQKESKKPIGVIIQGLKQSITMPFSGSMANEARFYGSLNDKNKNKYQAAKEEKKKIFIDFMKIVENNRDKLSSNEIEKKELTD